ncbi:MAG: ABC transporter permease [Clostridiaceae bacterium]|jgi:oligopeptide transport system permease protein|nr:ABC transporter permease [Clostridiaceae bacterium]
MGAYAIKRIASAAVTLFVVATLTFFLMFLVPGGPFLSEKATTPQTLKALEQKYGLDQPVGVQYVNYMKRIVMGDLGTSLKMRGQEVNDIIGQRFPVSARLGAIAVLIAIAVGIPLGSVAALNRGKWLDNIIMFIATTGIAVPSFVVATTLMFTFGVKLHILPTYGLSSPMHYVLPVMALAFYPTAYISRLMRSSMLDVLGQDYMRTARAKGISQFKSLFKHALRNAVLPVITYMGPMLAYILTGSFVVEKIFTIPGLGSQFISSITDRDYPLIMGTTIFLAFLLITMNVIVDIAYKIIDPRIKLK